MTRPSRRPRAVLAALAVAGLSIGGLAITAPPASAMPWSGNVGKGSSFDYQNAGCSESNSGTSAPAVLPANTATSLNFSDSSTGTGPTAPDTASMSSASTGKAQVNVTAG
jgi:hypothetical protein